ncbi:hypothetical protein B0H14DRAFT_3866461 [Mycena olivaceomarginata]|nr:hypothetical protein B0H14DRAFT_3866461 [Mycena olivaceomarginata]
MSVPSVFIRSRCDHSAGSQPLTKKRKATIEIDPAFLDEVWDLKRLAEVIRMKAGEDQLSEGSLREAFLAYMTNPVVIEFPSVRPDHLKSLRRTGDLRFRPETTERLAKIGDDGLQEYSEYRERVDDVVWDRPEFGCRMLINTVLIPAVNAAQKLQSTAPSTHATNTGPRSTLRTDHLVVVPDYKVSQDVSENVTFHGTIDYTICLVNKNSHGFMKRARSALLPTPDYALLTIIEVKTPLTLEGARPQIEAHGRPSFAGAMTNGSMWLFYLAVAHEKGVTIYESPGLAGPEDDGVIVAVLIELIRNPGTLPPTFELVEDF